jgi:hypothetical protein
MPTGQLVDGAKLAVNGKKPVYWIEVRGKGCYDRAVRGENLSATG